MGGLDHWFSLQGRVALVTGGTRGLGRAIADGLRSAGASVIATSRDPVPVPSKGGDLRVLKAQLNDAAGLNRLVGDLQNIVPYVDILVNNVGTTAVAPLEAYDDAMFTDVFYTNVSIPFGLTRRLLPMLGENASSLNPSRVINIGSVAGIRPQGANNYAYPASKSALHMLTRQMATALSGQLITVNAVAPGPVDVGIAARSVAALGLETVTSGIPLGRLGRSTEIAAAVVYLASPAAAFVTGVVLPVDGGIAAG